MALVRKLSLPRTWPRLAVLAPLVLGFIVQLYRWWLQRPRRGHISPSGCQKEADARTIRTTATVTVDVEGIGAHTPGFLFRKAMVNLVRRHLDFDELASLVLASSGLNAMFTSAGRLNAAHVKLTGPSHLKLRSAFSKIMHQHVESLVLDSADISIIEVLCDLVENFPPSLNLSIDIAPIPYVWCVPRGPWGSYEDSGALVPGQLAKLLQRCGRFLRALSFPDFKFAYLGPISDGVGRAQRAALLAAVAQVAREQASCEGGLRLACVHLPCESEVVYTARPSTSAGRSLLKAEEELQKLGVKVTGIENKGAAPPKLTPEQVRKIRTRSGS
ncbi:unnamed protein product [Polarella glacialis]|uniref:Uncharacterized protein n=1 Tax=Polarella glacialis TaxID=89957 RepID=A0A813G929_POLGL|nr:unnamed protein product [Polarella glacialis]